MARKPISFFDFMQRYPHDDQGRRILAYHLKQLAKKYKEIRKIDSLIDLMAARDIMTDPEAIAAVDPALWCEYSSMTNHPL